MLTDGSTLPIGRATLRSSVRSTAARTVRHTDIVPTAIPRQRLFVPPELYVQFRPIVIARGHENSRLAWHWLCNAVEAVEFGREVPSRLTVRRLSPAEIRAAGEIRWTQLTEEYREWGRILWDANSSPDAVVQAEIRDYIKLKGNVARAGNLLANTVYG